MRVVIFAAGTLGDVQPHVALGLGLRRRGHDVTLVTSREFAPLVTGAGLSFAPLAADFRGMMRRDRAALDGKTQFRLAAHGLRRLRAMAVDWAAEGLTAARGAGLIIGSGVALYLAGSIAEALDIPFVRTMLQPIEPAREITPLLLGTVRFRFPRQVNLALHAATRGLTWQLGRPAMSIVRRDLGLPPYPWRGPWRSRHAGRAPLLNGFSPLLVPPSRDWGPQVATTGSWMLRPAFEPADALARFLRAGPPPIYVGFGSMVADGERLSRLVRDAVVGSGERAVVSGGWAGLETARHERIIAVGEVPHDWLLPRVSLAVHHCGAGTTHAVAAAGIPSVPVPFLLDQFFWAGRLAQLGVATAPLSRRSMDPAGLADAVARAKGSAMAASAASLGERIRGEDGVGAAIGVLDRWGLLGRSDLVTTARPPTECEFGHDAMQGS